ADTLLAHSSRVVIVIIAAMPGISTLARYQAILGIDNVALFIEAVTFGNAAAALLLTEFRIDTLAGKLAFGVGGRWCQGRFRCHLIPHRLHHRFENRHCHTTPRRSAPQGATFAVGIVISGPDGNGDVVGEAHEPGIVLVV